MEYLAPFQNRTEMTFSSIPWDGKEYLQASFSIPAKGAAVQHPAAVGRSKFALAGFPQGTASIPPSHVRCSSNVSLELLPLQRGQHYSSPQLPSLLQSLPGPVLLMRIISSVLVPKRMQTLCQHPAALAVSNCFQT